MEEILKQIAINGLPMVFLGIVNNLLTTLIKWPIKRIMKKSNHSFKYTRYITFLPVILGLLIAFAYVYLKQNTFSFNTLVLNAWIKNATISLSLYAFEEKFLMSNAQMLTKDEIEENKKVLQTIKDEYEKKLSLESNTQNDGKIMYLKGQKNEKN